jgi:glycosyltransferase involved in cell wall biosynthesis
MRVSLILATKTRVAEAERFIRSLAKQEHANLELIVVDQNKDSRLEAVLTRAPVAFDIVHLHSEPGLSHARNVGLASKTGDIVAFPDDDCWYPDGLLARVVSQFESHPSVHGFSGRSEDGQGKPSGGSFSRCKSKVSLSNVWEKGISYTIFLRASLFAAVGLFDEHLGLGAPTPFLSGEETDYLIRTIKLGFDIQYLPDLVVFHANPVLYDKKHCYKAFHYGAGMGRVLSKHSYKVSYNLYAILRPVAGAVLCFITFRTHEAAYHFAIARGRVFGLRPRQSEKVCPFPLL